MTTQEIKLELESIVFDASKNDHDIHHSDDSEMDQDISISIDRLDILRRIKQIISKI